MIGDFTTIKNKNKNKIKYFVQISRTRLKSPIKYKAKLMGIEVIEINETCTSSVSAFDLERVEKEFSDKRRCIVCGLFKSSYGLINSDIIGSLKILRYYKNIPKLIKEVRDKGLGENPIGLRVI